jgi:hypothetical protein
MSHQLGKTAGAEPASAQDERLWHWRAALAWAVLAGFVSAFVFATVLDRHLTSDLQSHAYVAMVGEASGRYPGEFLYFVLSAAVTGFSRRMTELEVAGAVLLSFSVTAKVLVSGGIAAATLADGLAQASGRLRRVVRRLIPPAAFVLALAFSLPVPGGHFYLGQLPLNVWHNSTTIFVMPFALGLFWMSWRFLESGTRRLAWWTLALCAVNLAVKPSFFLPFAVVFPVAALLRFRSGRQLYDALGVWALGIAALAIQYVYIYESGVDRLFAVGANSGPSGVTVSVLGVWQALSPDVPLSLLASFASLSSRLRPAAAHCGGGTCTAMLAPLRS